jgi:outer membrane immunogenic protein
MKRYCAAAIVTAAVVSSVQAADLAQPVLKAPAVAPAAIRDWSGFYLGGHVGWAATDKDWFVFVNGAGTSHSADGFVGGGQAGYNWQSGNWIFGIEADASFADLSGSSACPQITFTCRSKVEWTATLAGRFGYAFGPVLFYARGGGAWVQDKFQMDSPFTTTVSTDDPIRAGWTVGAGIEYAFDTNWSGKVEYGYMDFGHKVSGFGAPVEADIEQTLHRVIVGLNYRFAPAGAAPR